MRPETKPYCEPVWKEIDSSIFRLLQPLFDQGSLAGNWSIWINGNWRITFRFSGADVELVDYRDYP